MRAILRENNIAVQEISLPNKYPTISVPFLNALKAYDINEMTVNDWSQEELTNIGVKEYDLDYEDRDGTLFYNLRKESRKMKESCCDEKEVYQYLLIGFKKSGWGLEYVDSRTGYAANTSSVTSLLSIAEDYIDVYSVMKILALAEDQSTVFCRDVMFTETKAVKAELKA